MRKFYTLLLMFLAVGTLTAQQETAKTNQEPAERSSVPKRLAAPTYKLVFSIFELQEGKKVNQRDYSILVEADDRSGNKLKIGNKVPIETGNSQGNSQFTYTDVGFDLECSLAETVSNKLSLRVDLQVSNFANPEQNANPRIAGQPVFRAMSQRVRAVVTAGKPQIITSTDDVNSNKRIQVEVTATKVD
jgi:hypothetical protein